MAHYLVTGGCGFIGSHLVHELIKRGDTVTVLDNLSSGKRENLPDQATLVVDDILNETVVRDLMKDADGCFHLAAIASVERSTQAWLETHRTNIGGTINIFQHAGKIKNGKIVPVVYASSAAVYGDNANLPLSESSMLHPQNAYGADKYACELHGRIATRIHQIPTIGLRFFNVFGPRQDPHSPYSGVISKFMNDGRKGSPLTIEGDGDQTRDFIYVGDVVVCLLQAMNKSNKNAEVFNVCTGLSTSIKQLANTILELCQNDLAIQFTAPRRGDIRHSLGSIQKTRSELNFIAKTTLKDGLATMLK